MKRSVRKRRVRMVFVLFLTLVLFLICAALPAFVGPSGKEVNVEVPATKDEPTQPVTTVPPVTSAATADEPAADGHKIDIEAMFQDELESGCEVYAAVTLFYNRLHTLRQSGELAPTEWPDFDAQYCSDDWRAKVAAVIAADEGAEEGRGFFSWNYWTCSADMAFTYVSSVEIIDKTGDRGTASLVVHCGEVATPVLLNMVYERGDWRIDDITNNWQRLPVLPYYEWKQEMENYLGDKQ